MQSTSMMCPSTAMRRLAFAVALAPIAETFRIARSSSPPAELLQQHEQKSADGVDQGLGTLTVSWREGEQAMPLYWFAEASEQPDVTAAYLPQLRGHFEDHGTGAQLADRVTDGHPGKTNKFFAEDAQRIAEMPPYVDPSGRTQQNPPADSLVCAPSCEYSCQNAACDQVCEPVCAPPQCETMCEKTADKCETKCGDPPCAVVCPTADCKNGDCAKCRTVCGEPQCTTMCSNSCHSLCAKPRCDWKCKPGPECQKPSCEMKCTNMHQNCAMPFRNTTVVPPPGKQVIGEGFASLDPSTLANGPGTAPPPWEVPPHSSTIPRWLDLKKTTTAEPEVVTTSSRFGPVYDLKMKWRAEDKAKRREEKRAAAREAKKWDLK